MERSARPAADLSNGHREHRDVRDAGSDAGISRAGQTEGARQRGLGGEPGEVFRVRERGAANRFRVKRAYYQLWFLDEKIRIDRQTLNLLADLERIARAQNEVGKVTLQDVYRARIEQDRLTTEIANLEDSRNSLMAQLKGALGLRHDQADPPLPARFRVHTAGFERR